MTRRVSLSKNRISRDSAAILVLFLEFLFFGAGFLLLFLERREKKINAIFKFLKSDKGFLFPFCGVLGSSQ